MPDKDLCVLVDEEDRVLGEVERAICHGNPAFIHRTAHVVVTDDTGRILLQKRSRNKDMQPGKWDTAVGGHLDPGEDYLDAALREYREELGHDAPKPLRRLFDMRVRTAYESENVRVFFVTDPGPFSPDSGEIDELRFFSSAELALLDRSELTPGLVMELALLKKKGIVFF